MMMTTLSDAVMMIAESFIRDAVVEVAWTTRFVVNRNIGVELRRRADGHGRGNREK